MVEGLEFLDHKEAPPVEKQEIRVFNADLAGPVVSPDLH
jgi:hypothetical protein